MLRPGCLFILILFTQLLYAQVQTVLQWARHFGFPASLPTNPANNAKSISTDAAGNVYTAGTFGETIDFNPGPAIENVVASGADVNGVYISKLDPLGNFVWVRQLPIKVDGPVNMTTDAAGNVYLTTGLRHNADVDPGPATVLLTKMGDRDAIVVKFDTNGNLLWARQFGGLSNAIPQSVAEGTAIAVDGSGNVVLAGNFTKIIDVDPGPAIINFTAIGTYESFIVKLNSNGNFIWAGKFGDVTSAFHRVAITDIKCDAAGDVYSTGNFQGDCDFDPSSNTSILSSFGPSEGFACKLSASGSFLWVRHFGNSVIANQLFSPLTLGLDAQSNVYIAGNFLGTQDVDPGPAVYNLSSAGAADAFLIRLTNTGNFTWAHNIGSSAADGYVDLSIDNTGSVHLLGYAKGSADLDPGMGVKQSPAGGSLFVSRFDGSGAMISAAITATANPLPASIINDPFFGILYTGNFTETVDFDPGNPVFDLTSWPGRREFFVAKLSQCATPSFTTLQVNSCGSYTLNSQVYDSSGTYMQVLPNSTGCDSIITLQLVVHKAVTIQTREICPGQSFFAGGAWQTSAGVYTDTLAGSFGCDSIVKTTLILKARPQPQLGPDRKLCADSVIELSAGNLSAYSWQDNSTDSILQVTGPGTYWVSVTDAVNCSGNDTIIITGVPNPSNFLNATDSICSYGSLQLNAGMNFSSYQWSTGATGSIAAVTSPGIYRLRVKDNNGCSGIDSIAVYPKDCIMGFFVPTAFTPNGDGRNDRFRPLVYGNVEAYSLVIYNRWGAAVFNSTDASSSWDGSVHGKLQASGVYVWVCRFRMKGEKQRVEKGTVLLIK